MPIELIIDVALAVLLAGAILGAFLLNRNLGVIRHGQEELAGVVRELNEATGRAQASVQELKRAGTGVEEALRSEIGRARALADELSLITEAGDNLADRLEKRLTGPKSVLKNHPEPFIPADEFYAAPDEGKGDEPGEALFAALKEAR